MVRTIKTFTVNASTLRYIRWSIVPCGALYFTYVRPCRISANVYFRKPSSIFFLWLFFMPFRSSSLFEFRNAIPLTEVLQCALSNISCYVDVKRIIFNNNFWMLRLIKIYLYVLIYIFYKSYFLYPKVKILFALTRSSSFQFSGIQFYCSIFSHMQKLININLQICLIYFIYTIMPYSLEHDKLCQFNSI